MAAPQQGGGQPDNSTGILWGIAALFVFLGAIWYIFKTQIIGGYLWLKFYEIKFVNYFFDSAYIDELERVLMAAVANPQNVYFHDLTTLGDAVGYWLRIPLAILLGALAVIVYFSNTTRVFKREYKMKDLVQLEKGNWPQITPIANLNLVDTNIDTGPWAMAMTPLQFCKRYRLIEEVRGNSRSDGRGRERIDAILKKGEANQVFALQLGPLWQSVDALPPYAKALFAAFAARINSDSKAALGVLARLNISSTAANLDMTGVDALIKKHFNTKPVQEIVQRHAYVLTVMASMLQGARSDGVQASADFLWLKPRDRRMWYTLNTVGRQTPFSEVAGIFAHWLAEKEAGKKLMVPMVEEATNALESALKDVVYHSDQVK